MVFEFLRIRVRVVDLLCCVLQTLCMLLRAFRVVSGQPEWRRARQVRAYQSIISICASHHHFLCKVICQLSSC